MTDEGAPLDGANGYSPLIRLLPAVAATFHPKGGRLYRKPPGYCEEGEDAIHRTAKKALPSGELSSGCETERVCVAAIVRRPFYERSIFPMTHRIFERSKKLCGKIHRFRWISF